MRTLFFFTLMVSASCARSQTVLPAPLIKQQLNHPPNTFLIQNTERPPNTYSFEIDPQGHTLASIAIKIGNAAGQCNYYNEVILLGANRVIPLTCTISTNGVTHIVKISLSKIAAGDALFYQFTLKDVNGNVMPGNFIMVNE